MNTDYDPEGISIPAQREAGLRKGAALEADLVREFIEPGRSGTSVDKRPVFQEMLAWLKEQGDIDYVIVYTFSRAFRNAVDAGITKRTLRKYGTRVVSTTLDLGESPESSMIETIMHAVDQYQSEQSGADIRYKMSQKAIKGGTLGRARIGYLNRTEEFDGRTVRTVVLDPQRAPLVRRVFKLFASDEYSIPDLHAEAERLGLTTRPTKRWPERTPSENQLRAILADPYYIGLVTYEGQQYPGRHEAIIDAATFQKVQDILAVRARRGSRNRVTTHYLRGQLFCERCYQSGRPETRLIFTESKGNGGYYSYYVCRMKQEGICDLPVLPVESVEQVIINHYATERMPPGFSATVSDQAREAILEDRKDFDVRRRNATKRLRELDTQEERLIDLAADGTLQSGKLRERLKKLAVERVRLTDDQQASTEVLTQGLEVLNAVLHLLEDPQAMYKAAADATRRRINSAFYDALYISRDAVGHVERTTVFAEVISSYQEHRADGSRTPHPGHEQTP
ncbi:recombinase family protein [Kribbella sp. CA-294648]|uniref:recombinase family protein n=1 Tax=Kribbella sp. CA-294648 TaxID=3239948 RepID=UPI003D8E7E15